MHLGLELGHKMSMIHLSKEIGYTTNFSVVPFVAEKGKNINMHQIIFTVRYVCVRYSPLMKKPQFAYSLEMISTVK